jgi:hypothetical protein
MEKQQKRGNALPRRVAFRRIFAHAKFCATTTMIHITPLHPNPAIIYAPTSGNALKEFDALREKQEKHGIIVYSSRARDSKISISPLHSPIYP